MDKIAKFLKDIKNVKKGRVLPYHNYAGSKYLALGIANNLPVKHPSDEEISVSQAMFDNF